MMSKFKSNISLKPNKSSGAMLGQLVIGLGAIGCATIPDPSTSVCREMTDDRCWEFLYNPNLSLTGIDQTNWYRAPNQWRPASSPLGGDVQRWRPMPSANTVFALPEPPATASEPTKAETVPPAP